MTIGGFFAGGDALRAGSSLPREMRDVAEFCGKVAEEFNHERDWIRITDKFFLRIERNSGFVEDYRNLEVKYGKGRLNSYIGRWIKLHYNLETVKFVTNPESRLIKAFTSFKKA